MWVAYTKSHVTYHDPNPNPNPNPHYPPSSRHLSSPCTQWAFKSSHSARPCRDDRKRVQIRLRYGQKRRRHSRHRPPAQSQRRHFEIYFEKGSLPTCHWSNSSNYKRYSRYARAFEVDIWAPLTTVRAPHRRDLMPIAPGIELRIKGKTTYARWTRSVFPKAQQIPHQLWNCVEASAAFWRPNDQGHRYQRVRRDDGNAHQRGINK